jgi:hypothetical protein
MKPRHSPGGSPSSAPRSPEIWSSTPSARRRREGSSKSPAVASMIRSSPLRLVSMASRSR